VCCHGKPVLATGESHNARTLHVCLLCYLRLLQCLSAPDAALPFDTGSVQEPYLHLKPCTACRCTLQQLPNKCVQATHVVHVYRKQPDLFCEPLTPFVLAVSPGPQLLLLVFTLILCINLAGCHKIKSQVLYLQCDGSPVCQELPDMLNHLQALPSQATIVSPAALLRHVSSTRAVKEDAAGGEEEPWNQDLLQALLAAIYKVCAASEHITALMVYTTLPNSTCTMHPCSLHCANTGPSNIR